MHAYPNIEGYDIVDVLGMGGMGVVYLARQKSLSDRLVAIKSVIAGDADADVLAKRRERLKREASLLAGAGGNPSIAQVHDFITSADGNEYIVMEYVKGKTLREVMEREGGPSLATLLGYAREVAAALHYAHRKGIVHRDVKPDNVMISGDDAVKVMDFGIALNETLGRETIRPCGTIHYASPEQIQGKVDLDGRSDIYSFGAMLYEIATGTVPFTGSSYIVGLNHQLRPPAPPNELHAGLPRELSDLIMHCLQKDPEARPSTAQAIANALAELTQRKLQFLSSLVVNRNSILGGVNSLPILPLVDKPDPPDVVDPAPVVRSVRILPGPHWAAIGIVLALSLGVVLSGGAYKYYREQRQRRNVERLLEWRREAENAAAVIARQSSASANRLPVPAPLEVSPDLQQVETLLRGTVSSGVMEIRQSSDRRQSVVSAKNEAAAKRELLDRVGIERAADAILSNVRKAGFASGNTKYDRFMLIVLDDRPYALSPDDDYRVSNDLGLRDVNLRDRLCLLGIKHCYGFGAPQDIAKGVELFEEAARRGSPNACNWLGYIYSKGVETEVDHVVAKSWYVKGAALRDPISCLNLGKYLDSGVVGEPDPELARPWFTLAAQLGNAEAMNYLGEMHDAGKLGQVNRAMAKYWFQNAAAAGNGDAMNNLGYYSELGIEGEKDVDAAMEWYISATIVGSLAGRVNSERLWRSLVAETRKP